MDTLYYKYERRNFYLRIVIILILLFIAWRVLDNKYGTPPSLEDQALMKDIFGENTKIIDCREALVYYAERELGILNKVKADEIRKAHNFSSVNITQLYYPDLP